MRLQHKKDLRGKVYKTGLKSQAFKQRQTINDGILLNIQTGTDLAASLLLVEQFTVHKFYSLFFQCKTKFQRLVSPIKTNFGKFNIHFSG